MATIQLEISFESMSLPNSLVNGHIEEDKSQEWKDAREDESAPVDIIAIMMRIGSKVSILKHSLCKVPDVQRMVSHITEYE